LKDAETKGFVSIAYPGAEKVAEKPTEKAAAKPAKAKED